MVTLIIYTWMMYSIIYHKIALGETILAKWALCEFIQILHEYWHIPLYWDCCNHMTAHCQRSNPYSFNTLRPRLNGRHFADDIFKCIFLNENILIPIKISLKFVPKGPINNIPSLVQIMAWRRPGDKPLSEPMMDNLPTHLCVTRPHWVKQTL